MSFSNLTYPEAMEVNVYEGFYKFDTLKALYLTFNIIFMPIGTCLNAGLVWYEKFGSANRYRTLLNQIYGNVFTIITIFNVSTFGLQVFWTVFGPFPNFLLICDLG